MAPPSAAEFCRPYHYKGPLVEVVRSQLRRRAQALGWTIAAPAENVDRLVQAIFANASTIIREPTNLATLVSAIDGLEWFFEERDNVGDLYEGAWSPQRSSAAGG